MKPQPNTASRAEHNHVAALKAAEQRAMDVFWKFYREFGDGKGRMPVSVALAIYLVGLRDGARIAKEITDKETNPMSSNLPPGVTPGMLPGNTAEDAAWERFFDWACDKLAELDLDEAKRAVLIGIAAVAAERAEIRQAIAEATRDLQMEVSGLLAELEIQRH